ncbi:hypothetical protein, partial [Niallia circulans]|uniref:hypothetical protein n=1 Tax=Niallia circulans TaxID=1397 RepID=UPI001C27E075
CKKAIFPLERLLAIHAPTLTSLSTYFGNSAYIKINGINNRLFLLLVADLIEIILHHKKIFYQNIIPLHL